MTKKKQNNTKKQLKPLEYIKSKARTLPIYKCYINTDWMEKGLASILVARQHINGKFTFGFYIIDTFCKGLVISTVKFNVIEEEMEDFIATYIPQKEEFFTQINIDYTLAHNIIYGAIAFAEDYKYKPDKSFEITKYILEEDDENVELIEIEFGVDGKPFLIERDDNFEAIEEDNDVNDDLIL